MPCAQACCSNHCEIEGCGVKIKELHALCPVSNVRRHPVVPTWYYLRDGERLFDYLDDHFVSGPGSAGCELSAAESHRV